MQTKIRFETKQENLTKINLEVLLRLVTLHKTFLKCFLKKNFQFLKHLQTFILTETDISVLSYKIFCWKSIYL